MQSKYTRSYIPKLLSNIITIVWKKKKKNQKKVPIDIQFTEQKDDPENNNIIDFRLSDVKEDDEDTSFKIYKGNYFKILFWLNHFNFF